jgi:hypothetical protein
MQWCQVSLLGIANARCHRRSFFARRTLPFMTQNQAAMCVGEQTTSLMVMRNAIRLSGKRVSFKKKLMSLAQWVP